MGCRLMGSRKRILPFGPSVSFIPTPRRRCMFEGWDRKRILPFGPSAPLHPSHTLRCGSLPLTAAGGQGPQGNTACGPAPINSNSLRRSRFAVCSKGGTASGYCPSDLPLRSIPPTPCGVGPSRLRPRVARVLRATPLAILNAFAPSAPSVPPTSSGGRGFPRNKNRSCL